VPNLTLEEREILSQALKEKAEAEAVLHDFKEQHAAVFAQYDELSRVCLKASNLIGECMACKKRGVLGKTLWKVEGTEEEQDMFGWRTKSRTVIVCSEICLDDQDELTSHQSLDDAKAGKPFLW